MLYKYAVIISSETFTICCLFNLCLVFEKTREKGKEKKFFFFFLSVLLTVENQELRLI